MSDFDPGPGWREVVSGDEIDRMAYPVVRYEEADGEFRAWVREDPLPTAQYTVIRATWKNGITGDYVLDAAERWRRLADDRSYSAADIVTKSFTGYEVLSEPRAVTAKALIERVRDTTLYELLVAANPENSSDLDAIARDFGVEP